jgi:hypothetical protein
MEPKQEVLKVLSMTSPAAYRAALDRRVFR